MNIENCWQDFKSQNQNGQNARAETSISIVTSIGTGVFHGSLFRDKTQRLPIGYVACDSNEDFVLYLMAVCHPRIESEKEQALMLAPAMFDPALSDQTDKGNDNVVYVRHVWLDFEDGDLKPKDFPNLFPEWRMVVVNSFSHTVEKPRFRVIIPTTEIMTRAIYTAIQEYIRSKLENAGYYVGKIAKSSKGVLRSGLDISKQAANSQFYLPTQAQVNDGSFFHYYEDDREFLNATEWIVDADIPTAPEPEQEETFCNWSRSADETLVEVAIAKWHSAAKGHGNEAFFQLAVDLRGAVLGKDEIESTLRIQAKFSRSPADRLAEIPHIMQSLETSRIPLQP